MHNLKVVLSEFLLPVFSLKLSELTVNNGFELCGCREEEDSGFAAAGRPGRGPGSDATERAGQ